MPIEKTNFVKAQIKDCALSSFKLYNEKGVISSLNKDEIFGLKTPSKNNHLIIQKSGKGNSVVLINKSDYLDVLYGLCKIHKKVREKCPAFRPILSAIKTPSSNLAKSLVPLIEPITKNNLTVKNSFEFSKEICEQNPEYFMASLGVEFLHQYTTGGNYKNLL